VRKREVQTGPRGLPHDHRGKKVKFLLRCADPPDRFSRPSTRHGPVAATGAAGGFVPDAWRGVHALLRTGGDFFQRFVVPHFGFGKQTPAFQRTKHRALTAQGFHRAVANDVLHVAPPPPLTLHHLKPISRQRHYDSGISGRNSPVDNGIWEPEDFGDVKALSNHAFFLPHQGNFGVVQRLFKRSLRVHS
jgi:hypothetical protein